VPDGTFPPTLGLCDLRENHNVTPSLRLISVALVHQCSKRAKSPSHVDRDRQMNARNARRSPPPALVTPTALRAQEYPS